MNEGLGDSYVLRYLGSHEMKHYKWVTRYGFRLPAKGGVAGTASISYPDPPRMHENETRESAM